MAEADGVKEAVGDTAGCVGVAGCGVDEDARSAVGSAANWVATRVATKSGVPVAWAGRGRLHPAVMRMERMRMINQFGLRITKAGLLLAVIIVKSLRIAKTGGH